MWEKEMFLKKNDNFLIIFVILFSIFYSYDSFAEEKINKNKIFDYLENINEFSASFIQIQENDISEGLLFIGFERLKLEYTKPSKLIFILKKNRGMLYNPDLKEVQYFNTKNNAGQIFFDLFYNKNFFEDSKIISNSQEITVDKEIDFDDSKYKINILFENFPLNLRKISVDNSDTVTFFSITNHNYNPKLDKKIFSLANPLLN